jgi:hypothetical protein
MRIHVPTGSKYSEQDESSRFIGAPIILRGAPPNWNSLEATLASDALLITYVDKEQPRTRTETAIAYDFQKIIVPYLDMTGLQVGRPIVKDLFPGKEGTRTALAVAEIIVMRTSIELRKTETVMVQARGEAYEFFVGKRIDKPEGSLWVEMLRTLARTARREMQKFCTRCGKEIQAEWGFCKECGKPLGNQAQADRGAIRE